jgi:hypothetical protein
MQQRVSSFEFGITGVPAGCNLFFGAKRESMIYLRYPTGGDTYEHKRTGKLITDAVAEFEAGLRSKAEQFEVTHAERKLTISVIETLWGETRKLSDEILKRVYTELTNGSEDKLVQEKKQLSAKRE